MNKTMAVCIGPDLYCLDQVFDDLDETKSYNLPLRPAQYEGGDVLLCSTGRRGTGGLYVFVGILHDVKLSTDRTLVTFKNVKRFPKPVVAVYQKTGFRRRDLIGDIQEWGPGGLYYVMPMAAKTVSEEAERSLSV